MRVAVIGSRTLSGVDPADYIPEKTTELVSGGAKGIDTLVKEYARTHHIPLKEFLPQYQQYGRCAPLKRNEEIVAYADAVVAIWDGTSRGTRFVIDTCRRLGVPCRVIVVK